VLLKVDQIPEQGTVKVSEPLPSAFIDEFLPDLQALRAGGPGAVKLQFQKQGENIIVHGTVACTVNGECASCNGPLDLKLEPKVGLLLFKRDAAQAVDVAEEEGSADDDDGEDELSDTEPDEGSGEYDGKVVDWGSIAREHLLLALPMAPRCKDDCAGLCPSCGVDRNVTKCNCEVGRIDLRWEKLKHIKLAPKGD
jgi:uncharacterized protein